MASRVFNGNERATRIFEEDGWTKVLYHRTVVVKFDRTAIVLNSGGRHTYTTKHRMNQASATYDLGYQVYQKDHQWYVSFDDRTYEYVDGMVLDRRLGDVTVRGRMHLPIEEER